MQAELALLERRVTKWGTSFLPFLVAPKQSGRKYSLAPGKPISRRPWCMFSGATQSGCGFAKAAMGPFYCPIDQKVYLDTSFFQDLERRFRACDVGASPASSRRPM